MSAAGCHVGESLEQAGTGEEGAPTADAGGGGGDGTPSPTESDGGGGGGAVECANLDPELGLDGNHPERYDYEVGLGQGCTGMCHTDGANQGPTWSGGGALYSAISDGEPIGGATIVIVDAAGNKIEKQTATNGFFWYEGEAIEFPATVYASGCPDIPQMQQQLASENDLNCNRGGCHGEPMQIFLPGPG